MPAPLLLDLSHTSHTRARTGVQRVCRSLHTALGESAVAITHDPHREAWRELEPWERANLASTEPSAKRGAQWPLSARIGGAARKLLGSRPPALPANSGLVVPEIFSGAIAKALPQAFAQTRGPRVAVFHDAIALRFPELTPAKTVARFPPYLVELLDFDGVAAVSEESREALLDYWRWLGVRQPPPVRAIPLGIDTQPRAANGEISALPDAPVVLCVGSIEGRKNHISLLQACEELWSRGERFSLHLVGLAQPQTAAAALAKIQTLQAQGRPLRYDGPVSDAAVEAAYAACTFTVYPSVIEGFGLPVIESLAQGKPCLCSGRGALGESAREGGCLTLDAVDAPSIAAALAQMLHTPALLARLTREARARRFKTWTDYARDLTEWICELPSKK